MAVSVINLTTKNIWKKIFYFYLCVLARLFGSLNLRTAVNCRIDCLRMRILSKKSEYFFIFFIFFGFWAFGTVSFSTARFRAAKLTVAQKMSKKKFQKNRREIFPSYD